MDINKKAQEDRLSSLSGDGTGPPPPVIMASQSIDTPAGVSEIGRDDTKEEIEETQNANEGNVNDDEENEQSNTIMNKTFTVTPSQFESPDSVQTKEPELQTDTNSMLSCPKCSGYFTNQTMLNAHVKEFHPPPSKRKISKVTGAENSETKKQKTRGTKRSLEEDEPQARPKVKVQFASEGQDTILPLPKVRKKKDVLPQSGKGLGNSWLFEKGVKPTNPVKPFKKWV